MVEADLDRVLCTEFSALDNGGKGFLSEEEVAVLLSRPALAGVVNGHNLTVDALMALMDKDSNGQISFEEFAAALHGDRHTNANTMAAAEFASPDAVPQSAPSTKPAGPKMTYSEPEVKVAWKRKTMTLYSTRRLMQE